MNTIHISHNYSLLAEYNLRMYYDTSLQGMKPVACSETTNKCVLLIGHEIFYPYIDNYGLYSSNVTRCACDNSRIWTSPECTLFDFIITLATGLAWNDVFHNNAWKQPNLFHGMLVYS